MEDLLVYVFCIIAFLLLFLSFFYLGKRYFLTLPKSKIVPTNNQHDMLYIYLPTNVHSCHTIDNHIHPIYGKQVETISSNKKVLSIKIVFILSITLMFHFVSIQRNMILAVPILFLLYAIFLGYCFYFLLQIPNAVILYKKGLSYKTLFYTKNIPYTDIGNICFLYNKHTWLSFHSIIVVTLVTGKHIYFREQHFSCIKDKIDDLQNNLCWSKVFTNTKKDIC